MSTREQEQEQVASGNSGEDRDSRIFTWFKSIYNASKKKKHKNGMSVYSEVSLKMTPFICDILLYSVICETGKLCLKESVKKS